VLTLFIPLIMSSGGNSGSAGDLIAHSARLRFESCNLVTGGRVALRELPTGLTLGTILGLIGIARIVLWQRLGFYDYGEHWLLRRDHGCSRADR